jgi:uncharacterized protein
MLRDWAGFLLLAWLLGGTAQAEVDFPPWTQPVIDLTGTLDPAQIAVLNNKLSAFESVKGSQIGVLMLPTTQPETLAQFGIRVFDRWKLGRKGVDDGVIMLVAKEDNYWRIEVGYGLEGALTDVAATRISRDIMHPYFKRGDYYGGLDAGLDAIIDIVEKESLPPPKQNAAPQQNSGEGNNNFQVAVGTVFSIPFLLSLAIACGFGIALEALIGNQLGKASSGFLVGSILVVGAWYFLSNLILALVVAFLVLAILRVRRVIA